MSPRPALLAALCALLGACAHARLLPAAEVAALASSSPGRHLTGEVGGLSSRGHLEERDFVYAVALSPDGRTAALTRLAGKRYALSLFDLSAPPPWKAMRELDLNDYEFDVEALAFSPDGKALVTAGRDGVARFFSVPDGKPLGAYLAEEPLVSATFLPSGTHVALGGGRGQVSLVSFPGGQLASERRAHRGEVRALVATAQGLLYSGGWDKTVALHEVAPAPIDPDTVRLPVVNVGQARAVRAVVDGALSAPFAFDALVPFVVVSPELARAAGVDPSLLTESVKVGLHDGRVSRGHTLTLKQRTLRGVDLVVCGPCVPKGLGGVLGTSLLETFEVTTDASTGELVLLAKTPTPPEAWPRALALGEKGRHTFDAYVNDLSADAGGALLAVAFSHQPAERTLQIHQREKRGEAAPEHPDDAVALLEGRTGVERGRWRAHRGVVSTVALSPDGRTVASGGWDRRLCVLGVGRPEPVSCEEFGWILRRARFSRDGRLLIAGAWTPGALGDAKSDPAATVYEVRYLQVGLAKAPPEAQ